MTQNVIFKVLKNIEPSISLALFEDKTNTNSRITIIIKRK